MDTHTIEISNLKTSILLTYFDLCDSSQLSKSLFEKARYRGS